MSDGAGPPQAATLLRDHFTMLPNLVDELDLDPYAYRLYAHVRRVAGEAGGACWQSTVTLAQRCRMSRGKVVEAKRVLVALGLIHIDKRPGPGGLHDHITLVDIWARNRAHFAGGGPASEDRQRPGTDSPPAAAHGPDPAAGELPGRRSVDAAPAASARPAAGPGGAQPVNASPGSVRQAEPMRSPGGPKQTPCKKTPPRKEPPGSEGDGDDAIDTKLRNEPNLAEAGAAPGEDCPMPEHAPLVREVVRLYESELGRRATPLVRGQIAELAVACAELDDWRAAFLASVGARSRWAYVVACVRNAAAHRACEARAPGGAALPVLPAQQPRPPAAPAPHSAPGAAPPMGQAPGAPPDPGPETVGARWQAVLAALQGMLDRAVYGQWFAGSRGVGEAEDGSVWRVAVRSPLAVDAMTHPGLQRALARALRYVEAEGVRLVFEPDDAP